MKAWALGLFASAAVALAGPASAAISFDWSFVSGSDTFSGQLLGVGDDGDLTGASFSVTQATDTNFIGKSYTLASNSVGYVLSGGVPTSGTGAYFSVGNGLGISLAAGGSARSAAFDFGSSPTAFSATSATNFAKITAVPEASTWVMLILGIGMVGGVLRNGDRKRHVEECGNGSGFSFA